MGFYPTTPIFALPYTRKQTTNTHHDCDTEETLTYVKDQLVTNTNNNNIPQYLCDTDTSYLAVRSIPKQGHR